MKRELVAMLTNDVETTSIWFNDLREATGAKVMREGMPRLLDVYAKYNVHPARWNDNYLKWWIRYYVLTLPKYQAKKMLKQIRNKQI